LIRAALRGRRGAFRWARRGASRGDRSRLATARLAQPAERKALNLVVVGSSPTVGVYALLCVEACVVANTLPGRLELPTLRLTASRSNQLSYGSTQIATVRRGVLWFRSGGGAPIEVHRGRVEIPRPGIEPGSSA
jgi:hypothetical protein